MTDRATAPGARADMVRNRRLLLTAAAEAFAEGGVDVSMGEIAQRAGVAKGTVFRHFPSKDDLLAAITLQLVDQLTVTAEALRTADDPVKALRAFMTSGVEVLAADRAFCEVIGRPSMQHAEVRGGIDRLCAVVEVLTGRAKAQGAIRADVTGTDIVLLLGGIHQTAFPLLEQDPQAWRRYLALAFDGLCSTGAGVLPRPPSAPLRSDRSSAPRT
ncbi:TetR/AcrR family transcriptional regulator [Streptomyces sp. NPDC060205]|uniref:TetR/AcrR family transcriptional regulator n=1 Tax=Streptomyces sp. NPDC060205 TaxID=3347072 RepID=UPI00364DC3BD